METKFYLSQAFTLWTRPAAALSPAQQRTLERIVRYYESDCGTISRDSYSITVETEKMDWGSIAVKVRVTRLDCHACSQRAMFCWDGGYFFIGKRGSLKVCCCYRLRKSESTRESHLKHLARMMRGTVQIKSKNVPSI